MDYIKLVKDIIEPLVNNPEELEISINNEDSKFIINVVTNNFDTARLIGKGGSVAEAIREVVNVGAKLDNKRVLVKFYSKDEIKK